LPSTIGTSTSGTATGVASQRKGCYDKGRHWVCFSDGSYGAIYQSPDGISWSKPTDVDPPSADVGRKLSHFFDGSRLHQASNREFTNDILRYRRILLNANGTISVTPQLEAIRTCEDEDGGQYLIWLLRKFLMVSPDVYSCYYFGGAPDYTTEINIGIAPVGCKTVFTPYVTEKADDFGYPTIGASTTDQTGDCKYGSRFVATRTTPITKIRVYIRGTFGNINVRAGIYSDSAGTPSALLGQSNEVVVTTTAGWYEFTFATPISVTKDRYYWLCIITSSAVRIYYDAGDTNQYASNADTYADGFSDPFGTPIYDARKISIYAFSDTLPTTIQMKGWAYSGVWTTQLRKLWILDGRFKAIIYVRNPDAIVHAGNLYARLWISPNSDLSGATPLTSWAYTPVSFNGTANQIIVATINLDVENPVGTAFAVAGQYLYLELLWDVTTAATNARVQVETGAYSTLNMPENGIYFPNITVDSQGYPWIGFGRTGGTLTGSYKNVYPYVAKGNANDGTWTFRLCTIRKLSTTPQYGIAPVAIAWRVCPVPLTAGKIRVVFVGSGVQSQLWDGSNWTTQTPPSISFQSRDSFSVISDGDDTILGILEATTYNIKIIKHTYGVGWDADYTILQASTTSTSFPVLVLEITGKFKVFWATGATTVSGTIYYRTVIGWVIGDQITWITEPNDPGYLTANNLLTGFFQAYSNYIGIMYMCKTSSPYNVRYGFLGAPPQMIGEGLTLVVG